MKRSELVKIAEEELWEAIDLYADHPTHDTQVLLYETIERLKEALSND